MCRSIIGLLLSLWIIGFAQGQDSAFFSSSYEARILSHRKTAAISDLLIASGEGVDDERAAAIQRQIQTFYDLLEEKRVSSKPPEKQVKIVFDIAHSIYLGTYVEDADFCSIFSRRQYNCVSATALIALAFKEYNIPFEIVQLPTHVYLVAYPNSLNIHVESTAPSNGYYSPSPADMQRVIENLVNLHFLSQADVDKAGVDKAYNMFFYGEEFMTLPDLAGVLYYNKAVVAYQQGDLNLARTDCLKASWLFPSKRVEFLHVAILEALLSKTTLSDMKDIALLADYAKTGRFTEAQMDNACRMIVSKSLLEQSRVGYVDSAFSYLKNNVSDTAMRSTIEKIKRMGLAIFYFNKGQIDQSLQWAQDALAVDPNNAEVRSVLTNCIVRNSALKVGDPKEYLKLSAYLEQFPFLGDNPTFMSLLGVSVARNAYEGFLRNDVSTGTSYLNRLEKMSDSLGDNFSIDPDLYALVYAEEGAYYYRQHDYKKAKDILNKALVKFPDDNELKVRLKIVTDGY